MSELTKYLNVYNFNTVLPGSEKEVNYKGLNTNLIKELLIYENEKDPLKQEEILDFIINKSVVNEDFDIDKQYILDRYYLFIKIREATKGSYYQFQWTCPSCKSQSLQSIDLQELYVKKSEKFDNKLQLNNGLVFEMDFPTREKQKEILNVINKNLTNEEKRIEIELADIVSYINRIYSDQGEIKINYKELIDFIGELPNSEMENINNWKNNNEFGVNLNYEMKCKCGNVNKEPLPLTNFFS